jgi:SAM-dependent methyltransferase
MGFVTKLAKAIIPSRYHARIRRGKITLRNFGLRRYCPCCKSHLARFKPFGLIPRPEARCPVCGALERHRLVWLYFQSRTNLFDGRPKKMLHVAPEPQLSLLFRKAKYLEYLSADLDDPGAMVKMDITDIKYPDNFFDVIYCSHVLEHVPDDRKAMAEFYRILKPGGWAILQVPITADRTFEDPTVTAPADRERLFGQFDHVRRYGPDYGERLVAAGFSVKVDQFVLEFGDSKIQKYGLTKNEDVYFCAKSPSKRGSLFLKREPT